MDAKVKWIEDKSDQSDIIKRQKTSHKSTAYSPFKIVHHRDKIDTMRAGGQPIPLQVQLIISDLCNHSCAFCAYRMDGYTSNQNFGEWDPVKQQVNNNPNRMIPYEKALEILDDCKAMGVKAIQYTGGGEPTVHPQHREIFARTLDLGLDLALVTNGYSMRKGVEELLTRAKWVRVSLDAATPATYSAVRHVPDRAMGRTLSNIERLVAAKHRLRSNVVIGVGFVVTNDNYEEIYRAARLVRDLGVDNIRISAVFTNDNVDYHAELYPEAKAQAVQAKRDFESAEFTVFDLFDDRVQDFVDQHPDYGYCGYMHLNTYIGGDLKVYSCCNNAYNDLGEMGSIRDIGFREFWLSEHKKTRYAGFDPKQCARCMFNNKNRFINYLLANDPEHVNYI